VTLSPVREIPREDGPNETIGGVGVLVGVAVGTLAVASGYLFSWLWLATSGSATARGELAIACTPVVLDPARRITATTTRAPSELSQTPAD
jgi:hypothetical protein